MPAGAWVEEGGAAGKPMTGMGRGWPHCGLRTADIPAGPSSDRGEARSPIYGAWERRFSRSFLR